MLTRVHVSVLLIVALAVWTASLAFLGAPLTWDFLKPFFITVSVLTSACFAFDRWLWHFPLFKHWLVNRPYVAGTWKVQILSNWIDPATGEQAAPITCVMVIRQTFSTLSARLFTRESSSASVAYNITRQDDGALCLFVVYQNIPTVHLRGQKSEIHFGAFQLDILGDPPRRLTAITGPTGPPRVPWN